MTPELAARLAWVHHRYPECIGQRWVVIDGDGDGDGDGWSLHMRATNPDGYQVGVSGEFIYGRACDKEMLQQAADAWNEGLGS